MLWGSHLQWVISNPLGNAMKTAIIFKYVEQSTIQNKCKVASITMKFPLVPPPQTRIFLHPKDYQYNRHWTTDIQRLGCFASSFLSFRQSANEPALSIITDNLFKTNFPTLQPSTSTGTKRSLITFSTQKFSFPSPSEPPYILQALLKSIHSDLILCLC